MNDSLALARHVVDRLGYGPTPGELDRVAAGGVDRWIDEQLHPDAIPLPPAFAAGLGRFVTLPLTPQQIFLAYGPPSVRPPGSVGRLTPDEQKARNQHAQLVAQEAVELRLTRGLGSPRRLEQCLTDFWSNHFNIFIDKGLDHLWLGAFVEEAIRPHILGRFRDLLGATARHPAMLFYLDNWQNTAPGSPGAKGQFDGINENYAREVMELHTVGVNGGYSQADVIALAHIFTGWTIGPVPHRHPPRRFGGPFASALFGPGFRRPLFARPAFARPPLPPAARARGSFVFDADRHDFSEKLFLGRTVAAGGIEQGETALDMLARSPATAHHISYQLAQFFLADEPDKAVTAAMAQTFLASDGDIRAVLRQLFASAAFRAPANIGAKFKSPYRYVISAVRAAGIPVSNFRPLMGMLNQLGERPYGYLTPDGYKDTAAAWLNPDAMMRRISFALALTQGHMPLEAPGDGLPGMPPSPPQHGPAIDADALMRTLGDQFSSNTRAAIAAAPPPLRAALVLGSPEFMRC